MRSVKSALLVLGALACLSLGFVLGCASLGEPGKPGYADAVPPPAAQQAPHGFRGERRTDSPGVAASGRLVPSR